MKTFLRVLLPDREDFRAICILASVFGRLFLVCLGIVQGMDVLNGLLGEMAGVHFALAAILFWCALTGWRRK